MANVSTVCNATEKEILYEMPAVRTFYYFIQALRLRGFRISDNSTWNEDISDMEYLGKLEKEYQNVE